jgi:hypothetical protein
MAAKLGAQQIIADGRGFEADGAAYHYQQLSCLMRSGARFVGSDGFSELRQWPCRDPAQSTDG